MNDRSVAFHGRLRSAIGYIPRSIAVNIETKNEAGIDTQGDNRGKVN
jgi:hypothetical protein